MCWVVSVLWGELVTISGEPSVSVSVCDLGTTTNSHPSPQFRCSTTERE